MMGEYTDLLVDTSIQRLLQHMKAKRVCVIILSFRCHPFLCCGILPYVAYLLQFFSFGLAHLIILITPLDEQIQETKW